MVNLDKPARALALMAGLPRGPVSGYKPLQILSAREA
jgi:hypothetical protein